MNLIGLTVGQDFTGVIEGILNDKSWFKNGKRHREDGPAIEWKLGSKEWYIDGVKYEIYDLEHMLRYAVLLETKKGKYDLKWLRFFTEEGIKEFPIIPGMEDCSSLLRQRIKSFR